MPPQTVRAILDAIRLLSDAQRRSLIAELTHENFTEPPENIVAMNAGLDQAERGELINHENSATYMASEPKERRHPSGHQTEFSQGVIAMEKARELRPEELQANPLLLDLLERAWAGGELVVTYQGMTVVLEPVEDITHTFSPEELKRFTSAYAAAEDPANRFTAEEALERFRNRSSRHG